MFLGCGRKPEWPPGEKPPGHRENMQTPHWRGRDRTRIPGTSNSGCEIRFPACTCCAAESEGGSHGHFANRPPRNCDKGEDVTSEEEIWFVWRKKKKSAKMEKMYSKVVQVTVRCRDCDERNAPIRVTVELQASKSGVHRRDLVVRLTDDADPYFLFNLTLCQEDFQSLKVQQGLLIEFSSFPEKLIELVDQCQSEQSSDHPSKTKNVCRFQLLLSRESASPDGPAHLSVMETNSFKHINHLSLSDVEDKRGANRFNIFLFQAEKEALEVKLQKTRADLSTQLNYAQQALSERNQELERLRSDWTLQSGTLTSRHADELRSEREKATELQNRLQRETQQLRQDLESAHQRASRQMQNRLTELETSCRELTDRKYKNEAVLRDLECKLAGAEEECQRAKQQAATLRRENASLDAALRDKERAADQLLTRVAVLEERVKDEEALLSGTKEALKAAQQQKESVQEKAQSREAQLRNLEAQGKILSEDVKKGNEIIMKFQRELQVQLDKLKVRDLALLAQEKELERARKEARDARRQLGAKDRQIVELKEKLDSSVRKLTETKEVLQKNENVIVWLNKQLNEKQLAEKIAEPLENTAAALTPAGPRAHFYPHVTKAAVTPDIIHKYGMNDSAGLDAKYFKRRDDSVAVYALPDALVPREPPPQYPKAPVASAYFTN
ncbi:spindle assembly abnormal protein 6 homolog isoform X3 [Syngnathoides biaculeatus]|uniref:spindle assembly abnormal protein 6 homolog isoform X3 n=1 Tax=Syngnathoides biaculeatus TaxID=300417 RepID=UPI002ADDB836|nr:spindle assembly abnormal protein 6 homolog isoform X3 [Syngnathoides biaculeatus]